MYTRSLLQNLNFYISAAQLESIEPKKGKALELELGGIRFRYPRVSAERWFSLSEKPSVASACQAI